MQDGEEETLNGFLFNTNTNGETYNNWVVFEKTGLAEGKHTIELQNADGGYGIAQLKIVGFVTDAPKAQTTTETKPETKAETTAAAAPSSSNPKTGDSSMALMVITAVSAAGTLIIGKKRKYFTNRRLHLDSHTNISSVKPPEPGVL